MIYSDSTPIRQACADFLRRHNLGADGGRSARWVRVQLGPVPFWFPNTDARRRALPLHDLHHVATGYDGSLAGEAELAAWELAAGCADYYTAWLLNIAALCLGLVVAPRRTWRAYQRGRRSESLYRIGLDERLMEQTVGALRSQLRLVGSSS